MHDSSVRIVEGRDVPSHPSFSEAPPAPTRPPSPVLTPTLEQGEASEVDGDVEMAEPEDDIHARGTLVVSDVVEDLDLAARASQHEDVPPPLPSPCPSAEESSRNSVSSSATEKSKRKHQIRAKKGL